MVLVPTTELTVTMERKQVLSELGAIHGGSSIIFLDVSLMFTHM